MTTPRIGDTVHYTDANRHCFAAIITYVIGPTDTRRDLSLGADGHVHVAVFGPLGLQDKTNVPRQDVSFNDTGEFTPGTWHHIH